MSETSKADYDREMTSGQSALAARDYDRARMHFGRAHGIGHEVRCRHVMAHRGLMSVSWRMRDIRELLSQAFLILATYAFDRPARA